MEYVQMTLNDWMEVKQRLKMELQGVKQSFVRIGYVLRKIDDQKMYEQDGYKTIAEFAKVEYGLEASTVSRFMAINREYSVDGYSEHLREEYLEMGRSQLEEMLKLPNGDRQMIQPEASREDIRELKRFNKTEPAAGVADDIYELIEKFYEQYPDVLNELYSSEAYITGETEKMVEIVNPGRNRSFKKGLFFLMMYEENIKIKKFGAQPQAMSWAEFFAITQEIFGEDAAGANTYRNHFGGEEENVPDTGTVSTEAGGNNADTAEERTKAAETTAGTDKENAAGANGNETAGDAGAGDDIGDRTEEEPTTEATEPEGIAPAQKSAESQETSGVPETPEPIKESETVQTEEPEIVDPPFGSRKDYLDSLTAYGMAVYMSFMFKVGEGPEDTNAHKSWENWLDEPVDKNGYTQ